MKDEDAFDAARRLAKEEGIFAGMSSGAAMAAAIQIASVMEEGVLVAILPDGGDRYFSTNLFTTMFKPDSGSMICWSGRRWNSNLSRKERRASA